MALDAQECGLVAHPDGFHRELYYFLKKNVCVSQVGVNLRLKFHK